MVGAIPRDANEPGPFQSSVIQPVMTRRRGAALAVFLVLALGLAWAVALPMWLGDGLSSPWAGVLIQVMMYTPAAAVVIVVLVVRPVPKGARLRFLGVWPLRPLGRTLGMSAVCLLAPLVVVAVSIAVAALFGWVRLDLVHFSGLAETLRGRIPASAGEPPMALIVVGQLVSVPFAAATINAIMAFGDELGWRGFLLPALGRLGSWPALLLSGAIWGLWHAPIILLGYNFGRTDAWGVLAMMAGGMCWGVLFGWLRLRTGSVWPAVFAHGGLNAAGSLIAVAAAAGQHIDMLLAGPFGAAGWIACALVVAVLAACGQFAGPRLGAQLGGRKVPLVPGQ